MRHAIPPLRAGHHLQLLEGSRAFFPALVVGAGRGLVVAGGGPRTLAGTVLLLAIQTIGLQLLVQVVYPV